MEMEYDAITGFATLGDAYYYESEDDDSNKEDTTKPPPILRQSIEVSDGSEDEDELIEINSQVKASMNKKLKKNMVVDAKDDDSDDDKGNTTLSQKKAEGTSNKRRCK
jgi:hypothetical protein